MLRVEDVDYGDDSILGYFVNHRVSSIEHDNDNTYVRLHFGDGSMLKFNLSDDGFEAFIASGNA